jgi:hypothetical protein
LFIIFTWEIPYALEAMDKVDGRIRAENIDIELGEQAVQRDIQRLKLYNVASLPQKIQLYIIIGLSLASLISNFTSIASTLQLFAHNATLPIPK